MEGGGPQLGEAEGRGDTAAAASTPSETQLGQAWPWFLCGPEELHFASGALLRQQLEEEMREVQNYVDHVRALTEARDAVATEYERENEDLRTKFTQLQLEHESQHKEVAELLALEGLASIVHSSPSEQVAYLLIERSSLLERMEMLEQELGAPHCLGRPCTSSLQDGWHLFHPKRLEEGFHQPHQSLHHFQGTPPWSEEPGGGCPVWEEAERGLRGAPDRLRSAQDGIPALKEDPEAAAERERGSPVAASELRKAREQNLLTDRLLLHDRLCFPEAERQASLGVSVASREAASDLGGCFKHELHSYKSELLRLYGELQALQGAAEERDFLHLTHKKLLQKNKQLEAQVLELSHECEHLNRKEEEEEEKEEAALASRFSRPEFPARVQVCEDQTPKQGGDGEPSCLHFSEASKMGEPVWATQEEEEYPFLKEILAVQQQLSAHRERRGGDVAQPCPPQAALGSAGGDTEQGPPHKGPLQPQEEPPGLVWGLQLQQENLKIQAELRQAQGKLLETSKACGALASQGELSQQKVKELELQLLQRSQAAQQAQSRLREQLTQESQRADRAEKTVQELEQRLQEGLQLSETLAALGRRQLEEETAEAKAKEAGAQRSLQEEEKMRKLLEQQGEEQQQQQQQQRAWLEKEAQLLRALADQQARAQAQEGQLWALEDERRALAKEQLQSRGHSQRLSEQLSALQQEKEALCEEQRRLLKQLDVSFRKQNERRLRHKARLRQAKEMLLGKVKLRDSRIEHMENEVRLSKIRAEKDQLLIQRVTSENESLFQEKQKTLEQLQSVEEAKHSNDQALRVLQSRVHLLEKENQQLQEQSLQLSLQVGILERALRTIHVHSLEELKSLGFPQCPLQRRLLPFPGFSFLVTRLPDPGGLHQAIKDGQPVEAGQKTLLSPLAFQSSGIGYVNLSGPRNPAADFRKDEPSQPVG